jgi:hypothetical protein
VVEFTNNYLNIVGKPSQTVNIRDRNALRKDYDVASQLESSLSFVSYLTKSDDEQRVIAGKRIHELKDITSGTVCEYE